MNDSEKVADATAQTPDGETNKSEDVVSAAEYQRVVKQRDEIKAHRDELKQKVSLISEEKEKELAKRGDVDALRSSYEEKLKAKDSELSSMSQKLQTNLLRDRVYSELRQVTDDPEVAYMLLQDSFELVEEGDRMVVRVKNSADSITEFATKELEKRSKQYLLKSTRKAGTDSVPRGDAPVTVSRDFFSMSKSEQTAAMIKDPDLRKQVGKTLFNGK